MLIVFFSDVFDKALTIVFIPAFYNFWGVVGAGMPPAPLDSGDRRVALNRGARGRTLAEVQQRRRIDTRCARGVVQALEHASADSSGNLQERTSEE